MKETLADSVRLYANRFQIEKAAGIGGMGTVYKAHDLHDGRIVALKLLHSNSADLSARFLREAQILSELRHSSIVAYVAHGQAPEGELFLAMEWLEGEDLGARLKRGPLSVHDSVRLLEQVADALSFAHQRGIIHRDLKPSNLFLCENDVSRTKVLDFGIARRTVATFAMTQAGMVMGTPQYMAPEQARATQDITPAADMFSLGCVLYECLAGQPPFVAVQIAALLSRILFEDPTPIEERRPGIAASLATLVNRLLQKDPAQRVPDGTALRLALANLGNIEEPTLPFDATIAEPIRKPPRFADQEQRLFSIVVVNRPADASPNMEVFGSEHTQLADAERQTILDSLHRIGAVPDFLANGSIIVTVPSVGTAQDQVTRAARAALLIKDHWPSAMISLATGRGILQGRNAVGEVVDRAANALTPIPQSTTSVTTSGIHLDTLSAKLLEGRFVITSRSGGAMLHDEAQEVDTSRPLLGKPTPCIGREPELNNLEGLLSACIDDNEAKVMIVTADAGVGKSRLRHEYLRRVGKREESITVLMGRGNLLRAGVAYRMITRAIHSLCEITGAESAQEQRMRFRGRIERFLPDNVKNRVIPLLGEMCGVPFSPDDYLIVTELHQHLDTLPEQIRWAALTWLGAECQAAPVVIVLDDLHWGDALSVAFIDEALHTLRNAPLFVLALARPEIHSMFPSLWKKHRPESIALRSLSKRACERLVEQALGKQIAPQTLEWIVHQSGGNALFLEELIRAAADGHSNQQPETVVAMLQARIGHLDARTRHVLLAASILGSTFWDQGVAAVLGLLDQLNDVNAWLDNAVDSELVELRSTSRFVGQREFAFRHALIHDAAYGLLAEHDRHLGHIRAAEYFETKGAEQSVPQAILGYHYYEAGQFDRALHEYRQAGDTAASLFLFDEAAVHYQHAERAAQRLPDGPNRSRKLVNLMLKQVQCSGMVAPPQATWQRISQARELLSVLDCATTSDPLDTSLRARLDYEAGKLHMYLDQYVEAGTCFERALAIAEELNDKQLIASVRGMNGKRYFIEGKVSRVIELLEPLLMPRDKYMEMDLDTVRIHTYLALAQAQAGHGLAAVSHIRTAQDWIDKCGEHGQPRFLYGNIAIAYLYICDLNQAARCCQLCIDRAQKGNTAILPHLASDVAAWINSVLGNVEAARNNRQHALECRAQYESNLLRELFEAIHAGIFLKSGDCIAAAQLAATAARSARERGLFWSLLLAERVWGQALAAMGANANDVDAHLDASLSVATEVGNVMETIQTEIAWGQIHLDRNEIAGAREKFLRARERLTDTMLPCTHEYYLPVIERGLMLCGISRT